MKEKYENVMSDSLLVLGVDADRHGSDRLDADRVEMIIITLKWMKFHFKVNKK